MTLLSIAIHSALPGRDFWLQLFFIASQIGIALYQASLFAAQLAISHALWAFIVALEIILLVAFGKKKWALAISLVLERIIIFNPALNLIRHKGFFYTSPSGSWMDAALGKNAYGWVFLAAVILLMALKFIYRPKTQIRYAH